MKQMSSRASWFRRNDHTRDIRLVMVGAFLGALVLLGITAFTSWPVVVSSGHHSTPPTSTVVNPVYTAQAGDCLNWTDRTLSDITKVDCKDQHLFEVAAIVDLGKDYDKTAAFPDEGGWRTINESHCVQPANAYMENRLDPYGKYTIGPLNTGEQRWAKGERKVLCGLHVVGAAGALLPVYGSAKNSNQSDVYDPGICLGIVENSVGDPVECAKPHTFEIVGIVDLAKLLPPEYSPEAKQDEVLASECARIAAEYSGNIDLKAKNLIVTWDTRAQQSWAVGSHLVNCKVGAPPNGAGLTAWKGSIRNPNAPPLSTLNPPQTTTITQQDATGAPLHPSSGQPKESGNKTKEPGLPSVIPTNQPPTAPTMTSVAPGQGE